MVVQFARNTRGSTADTAKVFLGLNQGMSQKEVSIYHVDSLHFRKSEIWTLEEPAITLMWNRIEQLSAPFAEYVVAINRSLTTGLNRAFVYASEKDIPVEPEVMRPLVTASDLKRFTFEPATSFVVFPYSKAPMGSLKVVELRDYPRLNRFLAPLRKDLEKRRWYGQTVTEARMPWYGYLYVSPHLQEPKLMFPKIASSTVFSWDPTGEAVLLEPAYIAVLKNDVNPFYVLACLNSSLLTAHVIRNSTKLAGGFTELQVRYVEMLPIRKITFSTSLADREAQLESLKSSYNDSDYTSMVEHVSKCVAAHKLDLAHDLLAFLSQNIISRKKILYGERSKYLAWLEDRLGLVHGIQTLSGHTIIQNYLGDYQKGEPELPWSEMEYRLYQNRGRFAANWESVKGEVQAAYEQSLDTLRPIKQRLAETDALIDRIVYRLYGLTDEEIRLVEQPAYEQALSAARAQVAADKKLQRDPDAAAEAVAARVLPAAQRLLQRVEHAAERASLDADLPGWHLYPDPVPTFLLTGEYNIQHQPDHLDFATSVMSYAKAVETMLFHRLFLPFRDEAGAPPAGAHNSFLRQFLAGERDKLTLGSMQIILASSKETALRAYAARRFYDAPTRLFGPAGVAALLADPAALALRNAAAHDQLITRAGAQSARAWAVSILEKL